MAVKTVLFTDESRALLDGPGGWAIIITIIILFRVPEGLKLSVDTYCPFLKNFIEP